MEPRILLDGLHFPECPRWRDGRLWFSDMHGHCVMNVDLAGRSEVVAQLSTQPAGLGWMPDGRLLAVSMRDRRLLRLNGARWEIVADLAGLASFQCNDLVVDGQGRAYLGTFGFDLDGGEPFAPGEIILVEPDGAARVLAKARFPNGMVITPDGRTLIAAESMGPALRAYDVAQDGTLLNGRSWAELSDAVPDGICLDAEGAVWIANVIGREVVRVAAGGTITQRVAVSNHTFACMLGGADRRTMFVLTADNSNPEYCRAQATGRIEMFAVEIPGAGLP
jgi:sugar lactone lactonase YvrE